jgi:hypothetical protein
MKPHYIFNFENYSRRQAAKNASSEQFNFLYHTLRLHIQSFCGFLSRVHSRTGFLLPPSFLWEWENIFPAVIQQRSVINFYNVAKPSTVHDSNDKRRRKRDEDKMLYISIIYLRSKKRHNKIAFSTRLSEIIIN